MSTKVVSLLNVENHIIEVAVDENEMFQPAYRLIISTTGKEEEIEVVMTKEEVRILHDMLKLAFNTQ